MSEALIMTDDPQLRPSLIRAIDYTIRSQHPVTGGWRYQPGDLGDTSQFGWQVMALVSAHSAGISIPEQHLEWRSTLAESRHPRRGGRPGVLYSRPSRGVAQYDGRSSVLPRLYAGHAGPRRSTKPPISSPDSGHRLRRETICILATMRRSALYQLQDHRWQRWNQTLTQHLLTSQRSGGELTGSWDPDTKWGPTGGRVYSTAMAGLCLETYYRYLPVYELAATRGRAIRQRERVARRTSARSMSPRGRNGRPWRAAACRSMGA